MNKRVPPGYDTVPLFIFWGLLLVWLVPWTVFLPQAVREVPGAGENCIPPWVRDRKRICFLLCGRW